MAEPTHVARIGQQLMGNLFRSREWQKLIPDIALGRDDLEYGWPGSAACGRTSDGQSIIAHLSSSQSATFDMTKITDTGGQAVGL